jgi:hypothetical protein
LLGNEEKRCKIAEKTEKYRLIKLWKYIENDKKWLKKL